MNGIATPVTRKAKTRATAVVEPPTDDARRLFGELGMLLYMASQTDEEPDGSGYSDRLLRMASERAAAASEESWIGRTFEGGGEHPWVDNEAFDIAALVATAMIVPGDPCSDERHALLTSIKPLLVRLTGSDKCVSFDPPQRNVEVEKTLLCQSSQSAKREVHEKPETDPYILILQAEQILAAIPASDPAVGALKTLVQGAANTLAPVTGDISRKTHEEVVDVLEATSISLLHCLTIAQLIGNECGLELNLVCSAEFLLQHAKIETDKLAIEHMQRWKGASA